MWVDLNCDIGQGFGVYRLGVDEALAPLITSANVACGFHAGDPPAMDGAVALAKAHGLALGALVAYPDLAGFGRRPMGLTPPEIEAAVLYQIGALGAFCQVHDVPMIHVKPHGALCDAAATDADAARAVARAVARFDMSLMVVGPAASQVLATAAAAEGLTYVREALADRVYRPDGAPLPRHVAGSLITDAGLAAHQAASIVMGMVTAFDNSVIGLHADTIGLQSDNPVVLEAAAAVREVLAAGGIEVRRVKA